MTGTNNKTSLPRLDRYLKNQKVRDVLNIYPDVKKEVYAFRNSLAKKTKTITGMQEAVEQANVSMKRTNKEMSMSATKYFVDNDPRTAVGRVLLSGNPEKGMDELIRLAKQDGSGEALKGLRVSVGEFINSTSGVRVISLFENERTRKALRKLYTPQQMKILDRLRSQMKLYDKLNIKATAEKPTKELLEQVRRGQIMAFGMWGVVRGRGIFMISRLIQKTLGLDPIPKARQLWVDSMLDPELAATMLEKVTPKSEPRIARPNAA
jgi:hypothetical protein